MDSSKRLSVYIAILFNKCRSAGRTYVHRHTCGDVANEQKSVSKCVAGHKIPYRLLPEAIEILSVLSSAL
jgi:hypothetical protein